MKEGSNISESAVKYAPRFLRFFGFLEFLQR
jgi:hypothetical protein